MREEVYRVVGTDRLPSFDDRGQLPYINAAIKEVYRWSPNSPLGAPRKLQDADVYRGFFNHEQRGTHLDLLSRVLHTERHHCHA
jgi:cytochrome P450